MFAFGEHVPFDCGSSWFFAIPGPQVGIDTQGGYAEDIPVRPFPGRHRGKVSGRSR